MIYGKKVTLVHPLFSLVVTLAYNPESLSQELLQNFLEDYFRKFLKSPLGKNQALSCSRFVFLRISPADSMDFSIFHLRFHTSEYYSNYIDIATQFYSGNTLDVFQEIPGSRLFI